jgi:tRNA pseudouridine55 synthase
MAAQKQQKNNNLSGLVLLAKKSGGTSFSSLWDIKHSLNTDKVGHTGTLDSFAEGLLVVLTGNLTHLVPHITGFTKTYEAVVCFGTETDTLDPCGKVINKGDAPSREAVEKILSKFTGALLQVPPVYSAVHVDGHRASDMARKAERTNSDEEIRIEPREIFVYKNELKDFCSAEEAASPCSYALLEIVCSKGTYIRSLARDMGKALGTCAHLSALRRTTVGPFLLSDAAGYETLGPFTIAAGIESEKQFVALHELEEKNALEKGNSPAKGKHVPTEKKPYTPEQEKLFADIQSHFTPMTPDLAEACGFTTATLRHEAEKSYLNGRPLEPHLWRLMPSKNDINSQTALFYETGAFAGIIEHVDRKFKYGFVVPPAASNGQSVPSSKPVVSSCQQTMPAGQQAQPASQQQSTCLQRKMKIFSWNDIVENKFPKQFAEQGTALSVGSFDGMHAGHQKLMEAVLAQKSLVPGIITFKTAYKDSAEAGEVETLEQKLEFCASKGIAFVVVIDFSADFATIEGTDFISRLVHFCGMKYLAEGSDFRCGYKGACTASDIAREAKEQNFNFKVIDDVQIDGDRVSSSRIREAVQKADFALAQKMLLRPFSYDCRSLVWNKGEVAEGKCWYSARVNFVQVLPPDGTFNVVAIMSESSEACPCDGFPKDENPLTLYTYKTMCTLECGNLRLLLPTDKASFVVRTLNFIPVNNGYPEK